MGPAVRLCDLQCTPLCQCRLLITPGSVGSMVGARSAPPPPTDFCPVCPRTHRAFEGHAAGHMAHSRSATHLATADTHAHRTRRCCHLCGGRWRLIAAPLSACARAPLRPVHRHRLKMRRHRHGPRLHALPISASCGGLRPLAVLARPSPEGRG